jgi:hypothetical protein
MGKKGMENVKIMKIRHTTRKVIADKAIVSTNEIGYMISR